MFLVLLLLIHQVFLMNAIPAIVAGVKRIIMINPGFKGKQNPAVLYAAKKM